MTRRAKEKRALRIAEKQQKDLVEGNENNKENKENYSVCSPRTQKQWNELMEFIEGSTPSPSILNWKSSNVPISAAGSFEIPIKIDNPIAKMTYEFHTKVADISFGISIVNHEGQFSFIKPPERYNSHEEEIKETITINGPALLYLRWDNEYSWLTGKDLAYSIELIQEQNKIDSDTARCKRAVDAMHDRQLAVEQGTKTLEDLTYAIDSLNGTLLDLDTKIQLLQNELQKKTEQQQTALKEKESLEKQLKRWSWEIKAISNKCLDGTIQQHIASFTTSEDYQAWIEAIGKKIPLSESS